MLLIDYINPLYLGNFNILYGNSNQGQKQVLNNIGVNYLTEEETRLLIYVTFSRKEANNMKSQLEKAGKNQFVIFTLSETPSDTEFYYLPKLALAFAAECQGKSILFCFDDVASYILKEKNLQNISKSYVIN
jgi:hypothetical protein